jgi:lipoprotein-releasing system ATP-binding protein
MTHDRAVLTVDDLSITFGTRVVVSGLSFELRTGGTLALTGPSGSGKTSVLSAILGQVPYRGAITVNGTPVKPRTAARIRRHDLGVVFQHSELLEELTPLENIALGALITGMPRAEADRQASDWLERFGVPNAPTSDTLSGGERQRVALARALIKRPSVVLADEPTGALDTEIRDQVAELLFGTVETEQCALLLVTHDPAMAARAQRRLRIHTN